MVSNIENKIREKKIENIKQELKMIVENMNYIYEENLISMSMNQIILYDMDLRERFKNLTKQEDFKYFANDIFSLLLCEGLLKLNVNNTKNITELCEKLTIDIKYFIKEGGSKYRVEKTDNELAEFILNLMKNTFKGEVFKVLQSSEYSLYKVLKSNVISELLENEVIILNTQNNSLNLEIIRNSFNTKHYNTYDSEYKFLYKTVTKFASEYLNVDFKIYSDSRTQSIILKITEDSSYLINKFMLVNLSNGSYIYNKSENIKLKKSKNSSKFEKEITNLVKHLKTNIYSDNYKIVNKKLDVFNNDRFIRIGHLIKYHNFQIDSVEDNGIIAVINNKYFKVSPYYLLDLANFKFLYINTQEVSHTKALEQFNTQKNSLLKQEFSEFELRKLEQIISMGLNRTVSTKNLLDKIKNNK